jgi:hypothetical protein
VGWRCTLQNADACRVLDFKLRNTTKELKRWSKKFIGSIRLQKELAKEVILKLEQAQDHHALSAEEIDLCRELKFKCLGLDSLSRVIARQRSRVVFLQEGARTRGFFTSKRATGVAKESHRLDHA